MDTLVTNVLITWDHKNTPSVLPLVQCYYTSLLHVKLSPLSQSIHRVITFRSSTCKCTTGTTNTLVHRSTLPVGIVKCLI